MTTCERVRVIKRKENVSVVTLTVGKVEGKTYRERTPTGLVEGRVRMKGWIVELFYSFTTWEPNCTRSCNI